MRARALALVLLSACGSASQAPTPSAPAARAPAEELPFLLGRWQSNDGEAVIEERWVRAPDGSLLGSGRVTVRGLLGFSETLSVVRQGPALVYTAWPTGQDPVAFSITSASASEAVFENPGHDFPRVIRYTRVDDHTLQAAAEGVENGAPKQDGWTMTLVPAEKAENAAAPAAAPANAHP